MKNGYEQRDCGSPDEGRRADIGLLAAALKRAAKDRGRPCTVSPDELDRLYGGPPAQIIERIGTDRASSTTLWELLGLRKGWGSCPMYQDGRFAI